MVLLRTTEKNIIHQQSGSYINVMLNETKYYKLREIIVVNVSEILKNRLT